jgi:hypothetical protein
MNMEYGNWQLTAFQHETGMAIPEKPATRFLSVFVSQLRHFP